MGVSLTMNFIILASLLLSSLALTQGKGWSQTKTQRDDPQDLERHLPVTCNPEYAKKIMQEFLDKETCPYCKCCDGPLPNGFGQCIKDCCSQPEDSRPYLCSCKWKNIKKINM